MANTAPGGWCWRRGMNWRPVGDLWIWGFEGDGLGFGDYTTP